jgi:molybdenum cofactor synthesis domain-containing protein
MSPHAELRSEPLDARAVEQLVEHDGAGAVVTFVGRVRDHNEGKPVTCLEYEAYPAMARREMAGILRELEALYPGVRAAVSHRVGRLQVGDVAVVASVSAAHRGEAFAACHRLIDEVKARVPIWKREHGPDGAYWVGWQDARCTGEHEHGRHAAATHEHGSHAAATPELDHHHAHHDVAQGHGHCPAHSGGGGAAPGSSAPTSSTLSGIRVACITVSDTRRESTDESGAVAEALFVEGGAQVARHLVTDDEPRIAELVSNLARGEVDAIFLTGGTGLGPRDVTTEAIQGLVERRLEGFGESFRRLSFEAIGPRAMLSRAVAGTIRGALVFAVPGSPKAVRLAVRELVIPILPHARSMMQGGGHG